jgi:hypothetical protein
MGYSALERSTVEDWAKNIWDKLILRKISIFLWLAKKSLLPTEVKIQTRNIYLALTCACCKTYLDVDDLDHLFDQGEWANIAKI